jgi:hypothetical protein
VLEIKSSFLLVAILKFIEIHKLPQCELEVPLAPPSMPALQSWAKALLLAKHLKQ